MSQQSQNSPFFLNIDQINIVMMLISLAIAWYAPFELVLLSYAFLGPAHYLTQISWMSDRRYFVEVDWLWIPFLVITLLFIHFADLTFISGLLLALALAIASSLSLAQKFWSRVFVFSSVVAAYIVFSTLILNLGLIASLMIPTVIHIYIFTGAFILLGALKSNNSWAFSSFAVFVFCGIFFTIIPPNDSVHLPNFVNENIQYFEEVAQYIESIFSNNEISEGKAALGFLSFAYTYHYLNWFTKVNVIRWGDISRNRLMVIATTYFAAIGLYLFDYGVGFFVLLLLSLMHVFLEFPLNFLTFKWIGKEITVRLKPS